MHNAAFALPGYAQAVADKAIAEARTESKTRRAKAKSAN